MTIILNTFQNVGQKLLMAAGKPWYRRSTPFGLINLLTLLPGVYLKNPVGIPFGQLGTSNLTPQTLACDIYSTLIQLTPTFLAQPEQNLLDALTWVISILDPVFAGTTFGCPASSFSSNGGNSVNNQPGTSNDPGIATCSEGGTNQYDQIYFPTAPQ